MESSRERADREGDDLTASQAHVYGLSGGATGRGTSSDGGGSSGSRGATTEDGPAAAAGGGDGSGGGDGPLHRHQLELRLGLHQLELSL